MVKPEDSRAYRRLDAKLAAIKKRPLSACGEGLVQRLVLTVVAAGTIPPVGGAVTGTVAARVPLGLTAVGAVVAVGRVGLTALTRRSGTEDDTDDAETGGSLTALALTQYTHP